MSLDDPPFDRLKFVDLPWATSKWQALKTLPRHVCSTGRPLAASNSPRWLRGLADHSGLACHPSGQASTEICPGQCGIVAVAGVSAGTSVAQKTMEPSGRILDTLLSSDIGYSVFYIKIVSQQLLPPQSPRAYVTPATWLNADWILGDEEAVAAWSAKDGPVRLLFAARLIPDKGVAVLLSAIESALAAGADFECRSWGQVLCSKSALTSAFGRRQKVRADPGARHLRKTLLNAAAWLRWRASAIPF